MNKNIGELEIKELKKINKYTEEAVEKINNGYPIQYLIGYVNFYGLKINISPDTLIPRYETEYLVEKLIDYIKKYNFKNPEILDLCTGSGCIGLTLKHEIPTSSVDLSDISEKALHIAKQNKKELNLNVNIYKGDLFESINKKYDIIVSNPPYVMTTESLPREVAYEPSLALFSGDKGINHIEEILKNCKNYLKEKYIIALEINEKSEIDLTVLVKKYLPDCNYSFEKDLAGKTRYLFIFKNCE